jgi:hypothetical protein
MRLFRSRLRSLFIPIVFIVSVLAFWPRLAAPQLTVTAKDSQNLHARGSFFMWNGKEKEEITLVILHTTPSSRPYCWSAARCVTEPRIMGL